MKVFVLVLSVDISSTPGSIHEFIEVSTDEEDLTDKMEEGNEEINEEWDEDDQEWDGMSMSSKPYYFILEKEI